MISGGIKYIAGICFQPLSGWDDTADKYSSPKVEEPRQENKNVLCLVILIASSRVPRLEWRKRLFLSNSDCFLFAQYGFCPWDLRLCPQYGHERRTCTVWVQNCCRRHFTSWELRCDLMLRKCTALAKNRNWILAKNKRSLRCIDNSYTAVFWHCIALYNGLSFTQLYTSCWLLLCKTLGTILGEVSCPRTQQ